MNVINKVTLKFLKKNRARTIVTIIGVILSAAMITAVVALVSSMQNYMVNLTIVEEGDWHVAAYGVNYKDVQAIRGMDEISDAAITKALGYSMLEGSKNEYKPYLYVLELNEDALEMLPIHLISGRLPQNENELVISSHILTNGGVNYKVGDRLTLDIGDRMSEDGFTFGQKQNFVYEEGETLEKLVVRDTREFTVVGICERLSHRLEPFSAPGYTVLTLLNPEAITDTDSFDMYFKLKNPADSYSIVKKLGGKAREGYGYNSELLRYMGVSDNDRFIVVLYSLGAIFIALIMFGSVALIYNSFSISVSERKKQFGLLSGVGATSRQLRNSVFFEAFVIGGIGIPIGVLSGLLGIYITLYFVDDLFSSMISSVVKVPLTLSISVPAIIVAILVAFITILISAYIPARRSGKMSAMDAIRQVEDIKLTKKQVKTSRLTRLLFGIEGDLAMKNMKRNRRRYRSTVVSLFISIVLFVSASAYSMYLKDSVESVYQVEKYDLSYYVQGNKAIDWSNLMKVYDDIVALDSIDEGSIIKSGYYGEVRLPKEQVEESYYERQVQEGVISNEEDPYVNIDIFSVDDSSFADYIKELGIDEAWFKDPDSPAGIVIDKQHYYDVQNRKYRNTNIFKEQRPIKLSINYWCGEENTGNIDITVAAFADTAPLGIMDCSYNRNGVILIISEKVKESLFGTSDEYINTNMYFSAEDPFKAEEDIKKILLEHGLSPANIYNAAKVAQNERNLITIISVFSYGFIILISLITIANVFNTISTNVNLRRREFAMLKSVGMTSKSFNKMLNFECIFYGLKALLYGLPVSIIITYLIYRSINEGVDMAFYLPVKGILISILSVFLVVFISMMYSMSKIRNENILDALKNENL